MNVAAMVITTLLILSITGSLIWASLFIAGVRKDLRTFRGFDGMHFEAAATEQLVEPAR